MGKNVSDVVMGMLSDAGSTTRMTAPSESAPATTSPKRPILPSQPSLPPTPRLDPVSAATPPEPAEPAPTKSISGGPAAPRTLRLRPATASQLREAWLAAKRDDVLLTAQDFASDLVEEALVSRRRRRRPSTTA